MKTLSKFGAKSISGSGDIDRGHKKPPPPQTYKGQKSPGLIGLNGEPIKIGTDGILNFDQSKMLFPVMCHLMYIDTTIFAKISDYATAVFSVHSKMSSLKSCSRTFQYGGCISFLHYYIIGGKIYTGLWSSKSVDVA